MVAARGSLYFSCARDGANRRLARSKDEREYMDPSYWKPYMCEESLAKLDEEDYIRKPFTSRAENFQIVMALLRPPLFADQMKRRHKDASVETILWRAVSPDNAEYLLNGSRYLRRRTVGGGSRLPIGATTNEAVVGICRAPQKLYLRMGKMAFSWPCIKIRFPAPMSVPNITPLFLALVGK